MGGEQPTRVVVVEDDQDTRLLLRSAFSRHPRLELVGEAPDGATGIDRCRELRPEVVVLDLGLPDIPGHDLLARLRDELPGVRVVVHTAAVASRADVSVLGVADIVRKGQGLARLVEAIEAAATDHPMTAAVELEQDPRSASDARRFVRDTLEGWGCGGLVDDALLVVSELTTNAVVHGASRCRVAVGLTRGALRIEVSDLGTGSPEPQQIEVDRVGGRGLLIVSSVADAWGIDPLDGGGKVVWAELAA